MFIYSYSTVEATRALQDGPKTFYRLFVAVKLCLYFDQLTNFDLYSYDLSSGISTALLDAKLRE